MNHDKHSGQKIGEPHCELCRQFDELVGNPLKNHHPGEAGSESCGSAAAIEQGAEIASFEDPHPFGRDPLFDQKQTRPNEYFQSA